MSRHSQRGLSSVRAITISIATVVTVAAIVSAVYIVPIVETSSNQPPTANFIYSPGSPTTTEAVYLTDTSTDSDGTIVSWSWSFGDGSASMLQNPVYQYTSAGTYTVTLSVTDNDGATSTISQPIAISSEPNQPPTASFTYSPGAPTTADAVRFTDTSTDSDGAVVAWSWSFGDGSASTLQSPTHQYATDGTYTVTLTVTDNDGATGSVSLDICVGNQPPNASLAYSPGSPTTGDSVHFTDMSTDSDGTIVAWSWNFGNGSASTSQNPVYQYSSAGTFTVTLIVTDNGGANDNISVPITVSGQPPNASFTYSPSSPTENQSVSFDGSGSSDPDGSIVNYGWNFGDGSTGSGAYVTHAYSPAGSYSVTLTVTDDSGLTDNQTQTVTVTYGSGTTIFAPPLKVVGAQILNADGNVVRFKGVTTEQAWNHTESDIQYLKNQWKVNAIRLPMIPGDWWYVGSGARETYLSDVDQFLNWTWNNQIYVVMDGWQDTVDPRSELSEIQSAWHTLANRYKNWPHIIWDPYNEPTGLTWSEWVPIAEGIIDIVRSYNPVSNVFTVPGVHYARDFDVRTLRVNRDNVIYAAHNYPDAYGDSSTWDASTWDTKYGYIALEGYGPVLVEEWGFPHWGQGNRTFGETLLSHCSSRSFGWIGWVWSDTWTPEMFRNNNPADRTEFGQLTWEALTGVWGPS